MFYKSIQFPSVAVFFLAFFCIVHAATAGAKVYSVTNHGAGTKSDYSVAYNLGEFVDMITELIITVPRFGKKNYVEIKADLYFNLGKGGVSRFWGDYFDYKMSGPTHGGPFGKNKFTISIWCNAPGSSAYIGRTDKTSKFPKGSPIINDISCRKG